MGRVCSVLLVALAALNGCSASRERQEDARGGDEDEADEAEQIGAGPNRPLLQPAPFAVPTTSDGDQKHEHDRNRSELSAGFDSFVGGPSLDRDLTAGQHHTCILQAGGAVACWGANYRSQLGDGTTETRLSPTKVANIDAALSIAAGADFTCARRAAGNTVSCWGDDGTIARDLPTDVGLTNVAEIIAGNYHACARRLDGTVACWGSNNRGQIGDGTVSDRAEPTDVHDSEGALLNHVQQLAAGKAHTCARRVDGTVLCWGHNFYGQVGDHTAPNYHLVPFVVPGLHDAIEISAGHYHTCALRSSGDVSCWGQNLYGQLGDGTLADHAAPAAVAFATGSSAVTNSKKRVVQITAGGYHTCARHVSGEVSCWGYNEFGQLGDGSINSRTTPVPVMGLADAVDVVAGRFSHTCARHASGAVACWGWNLAGEIGDGTTDESALPVTVVGL